MDDKGISLDMSYDEYIKIFNRLTNVGRIHPIDYCLEPSTTPTCSRRVVFLV